MPPLGEPTELQSHNPEGASEQRRFHDPNLETLLHPDYPRNVEEILRLVERGLLRSTDAHSMIMQMFTETAARDRKTGLYLKEAIEIKLGALMDYCKETGLPLSVIYLDGDNFKRINDQLGHNQGEETIQIMAQAIRETTRSDDLSVRLNEGDKQEEGADEKKQHARMGGDEFLMVLPEADAGQALQVLNRFVARLSSLAERRLPEHQSRFGSPLTASAGIVQYDPIVDKTPADLIERAEMTMKRAKQQTKGGA